MHHRVQLDKAFLERLRTSPRRAVTELLWNAVDADADVVRVTFDHQKMTGVARIVVADDGHGMTVDDATEGFQRLGGSWKARIGATRGKGRTLHGREGRGRFFAATLAGHSRWDSVAGGGDGRHRRTRVDISGVLR